jgi:hypothetical protein
VIHRLVYYSRNRLTNGPLNAWMIKDILAASRANNTRVGVTGALMFNAGCFAQVLEGPRGAVEDTFERIQQDERHGEVSLLDFGPVAYRAFATWSMGFVGSDAQGQARFAAVAGESGFDPQRFTGERLFEALHRLALDEEVQAQAA